MIFWPPNDHASVWTFKLWRPERKHAFNRNCVTKKYYCIALTRLSDVKGSGNISTGACSKHIPIYQDIACCFSLDLNNSLDLYGFMQNDIFSCILSKYIFIYIYTLSVSYYQQLFFSFLTNSSYLRIILGT